MLSVEDIKKCHVVIATPCYGGQLCQNYVMSMIRFISEAQRYGMNVSFIIRGGDSLIPRTRNSIVSEFMSNPIFTHLLWIDADIGFEPNAILRLLSIDRDVAGGVYPLKKIVWPEGGVKADTTREQFEALNTHYPFNPVGIHSHIDEYGFMEVLDLPTGLMMIKREVFERMAKAYPNLTFVPDHMLGLEHVQHLHTFNYRFFDVMTEESGRYLSEDYAFCRRFQAIGGKVYADAQSNLTHHGTHIYTGNFMASIIAKSEDAKKTMEAQGAVPPSN